jgi:hypothetical protein
MTVEKLNNVSNNLTNDRAMRYITKTVLQILPHINLQPITANKIKNKINDLQSKDSCRYDDTSKKLFRTSSDYINVPLNYLCNQ